MTDAEQLLWRESRARRFEGLKFGRQRPLGRYIVDFVCLERGLVIELDGGQRAGQVAYDRRRNVLLHSQGFAVLRFWNHDVLRQSEVVLEQIRVWLGEHRRPSPPAPLP